MAIGYGACSVQVPVEAQGVSAGFTSGATGYTRASKLRGRTCIDVSGFAAIMVAKTSPTKNAPRPTRADRFENADTEILRVLEGRCRSRAEYFVFIAISYGRGIGVGWGLSVGATLDVRAAAAVSDGNAPGIRCVLIVELMFTFTLPPLRCVTSFTRSASKLSRQFNEILQCALSSSAKITAAVLE